MVFIKILRTIKTAGGNFWGHLLGNHCKGSPWHCCSWEMGVVPLLLGHPVTRGLPCWFNGGVSTSLGCKWATGGEFFLLHCHMKPLIFLTTLHRKTVPLSFATAAGGRGQSSCPRYPKARVDCADRTASARSGGGVGAARSGSSSRVNCKLSRFFFVFICCLYGKRRAGRDLANCWSPLFI